MNAYSRYIARCAALIVAAVIVSATIVLGFPWLGVALLGVAAVDSFIRATGAPR